MIPIAGWFRQHGAHHDIVHWAEPFGEDWRAAWESCSRGDWLLAWACRAGVEPLSILRATAAVAALALPHVPLGEGRPAAAVEAARLRAEGALAPGELSRAADAADAAAEQAPDAAAAVAATAAAHAARTLENLELAAACAANVAEAAVLDAGECAMMAALSFAHGQCAEAVRLAIPFETLEGAAQGQAI